MGWSAFSFSKRRPVSARLAYVGVEREGVYTLVMSWSKDNQPVIEDYASLACADEGSRLRALRDFARARGLRKIPCTTLLDHNTYKLVMTDAPEVPTAELRAALRWKIKDLIDVPVQEVTIDVIKIPQERLSHATNPVYVIIAENRIIKERVQQMSEAGINLQIIDVTEMALRNIITLLPHGDGGDNGTALLWLRPGGGMILLAKENNIYLCRNLTIDTSPNFPSATEARAAERTSPLAQVVLELQRSLDYYESHYRRGPIHTLCMPPAPAEMNVDVTQLSAALGIAVQELDVRQYISSRVALPEDWHIRHLPAVGAALRQEVAA